MYFEFCQILPYGVFDMFFGLTVLFTNIREYVVHDALLPSNT